MLWLHDSLQHWNLLCMKPLIPKNGFKWPRVGAVSLLPLNKLRGVSVICPQYGHVPNHPSELVQPPWRIVLKFLKKLGIELPYDLAIPLVGIYPKEKQLVYWRTMSTFIFTEALFTTAKIWGKKLTIHRRKSKEKVTQTQWSTIQA